MELVICFVVGFVAGALAWYLFNHKNEISYSLSTIKEDLTSLHVKIDKFISSCQK